MTRRRKRSRNRKIGNHRQAPRPATWDIARGNCRLCGEPIIENGKQNNRKRWHQACGERWFLINNLSEAKKKIFIRDKAKCNHCDFTSLTSKDFDADHIKPLYQANGNLLYWELSNLQLLCKSCHKKKTKQDMVIFRSISH